MYVDAALRFSNAQAVTAAAGSTEYVDLGSVRDIGTGEDLYLVVSVVTALTDGGSNTGTAVAIEGDSTTSFTPDGTVTVFTFAQTAAAGTTKIVKLSPGSAPLQYQYIRLKYTPAGADLTGGAFTAFLTTNVDAVKYYADAVNIAS
jgi:hypothetical protein